MNTTAAASIHAGGMAKRLEVRNPRTGETDYSFEPHDAAAVGAIATRLRAAQPAWNALGIEGRAAVLRRWSDELEAHSAAIIEALAIDTGRHMLSVNEVNGQVRNVRRWCDQSATLLVESSFASQIVPSVTIADQYVPYALVGAISPWNFPMVLSLIDAVPALLAGSAVLLKPSEVTPRFAVPLARTIEAVPELAAVFGLVLGGPETGQAVVDNADVICFTGSVATGRKVAQAAAARFIPAFLELGGKDPAVVLPSADVERAVDIVLRGAVAATGQACMSLERIYVPRAMHDAFVARLVAKAREVRLCWPDAQQGHLGPIIFARQAETLRAQLADAVARGARVETGGEIETHGGGLWCRATVVTNVDHSMSLMKDETFGPIVPVMAYDSVDEAVELANDTEFGLSGCVIAATTEEAAAVGRRINAGGISINDSCLTLLTYEAEKHSFRYSGLGGSRMGPASFKRFFRRKALLMQGGTPAALV